MSKCKICGGSLKNSHWGNRKICSKECSRIDFWNEKIEIKDKETTARINGEHFIIGKEDEGVMRGFAGRKFKIRFFDGRVVVTTNLWYQGEIPEEFREELPDNAEFMEV